MVNKEEILYWAAKKGIVPEEIPGGLVVDEWKITLDENNLVTNVERKLDEPTEL